MMINKTTIWVALLSGDLSPYPIVVNVICGVFRRSFFQFSFYRYCVSYRSIALINVIDQLIHIYWEEKIYKSSLLSFMDYNQEDIMIVGLYLQIKSKVIPKT